MKLTHSANITVYEPETASEHAVLATLFPDAVVRWKGPGPLRLGMLRQPWGDEGLPLSYDLLDVCEGTHGTTE